MVSHAKTHRDEIVGPGRQACPDISKEIRIGYPLMSGVAHEIGNMLAVVAGWVQCWEEAGAVTSETGPAARGVEAGLGRIRYALDRLSSPSSRPHSHLTVVDVNAVLRHSLGTLGPNMEKGHKLTGLAVPDPWPVVGDFSALDFVLVNLVMNAVALSPPGSPIFVKSNNVEADSALHGIEGRLAEGAYVSLSVHHYDDHGGQESSRQSLPGVQQSLPLCLRILEDHGGLLQSTVSAYGESQIAMFLPAVARMLPGEHADGDAPERCP